MNTTIKRLANLAAANTGSKGCLTLSKADYAELCQQSESKANSAVEVASGRAVRLSAADLTVLVNKATAPKQKPKPAQPKPKQKTKPVSDPKSAPAQKPNKPRK